MFWQTAVDDVLLYGPGACGLGAEYCAHLNPLEFWDNISNVIRWYRATVIDRFIYTHKRRITAL